MEAGDRIYATSFGKHGENGNEVSTGDGIRVTFFDAYGVVKTMGPAETYAEFSANGGYLIAPEGTVAVNVPMWNNSDSNELYILNREHTYENGVCTACSAKDPSIQQGDVNLDGIIDASDVNYIYRSVMGYATLTEAQKLFADFNGDDIVNSSDVNLLYRYVIGEIKSAQSQ
jgi:hypothetical protein